jgi:hypothetical protein
MSLTLELTPEEEAILRLAEERGLDVRALLIQQAKDFTETHGPAPNDFEALRALFARWDEEDEAISPEEAARENEAWEAFLREHPLRELRLREPAE